MRWCCSWPSHARYGRNGDHKVAPVVPPEVAAACFWCAGRASAVPRGKWPPKGEWIALGVTAEGDEEANAAADVVGEEVEALFELLA